MSELRQRLLKIDQFRRDMLTLVTPIDVLICPTAAEPAYLHGATIDHFEYFSYNWPFNITGWPVTVINCGFANSGLPIGLQIAGKPWQDHMTLAVGKYLQKVCDVPKPIGG